MRILALLCLALPAAALAAGPFTLQSAEIKPGATIAEAQVFKGFGDANASAALVGFMANADKLGKASFTGMYGRKK